MALWPRTEQGIVKEGLEGVSRTRAEVVLECTRGAIKILIFLFTELLGNDQQLYFLWIAVSSMVMIY